jgi:hypothetical protein
MDELDALDAATRQYRRTEGAHEKSRELVTAAVTAALRAGRRPTDVAARSPFTETYVRKLARQHGIPDYLLRRFPTAPGELEAILPDWRDVARVIGALGCGLDDEEYVGGVLWLGLTHKGGPAERARVIVDRLTRWATRDGGDGSEVACAVRAALDDHL